MRKGDYGFLLLCIVAVLVCLVTVMAAFSVGNSRPALIKDNLAYVVVIDAGHGGIDGGVSGVNTGVKESDLNLEIAFKLKKVLENNGFTVVITREDKGGLYGDTSRGFKRRDMAARKDKILAANADVVVSVHQNSYRSSYRSGAQVFFQKGSDSGERFARDMQQALNALSGNKTQALGGDYYICRCSSVPSVIVECGFLTNPADEAKLMDHAYQEQLSGAILEGIAAFLFK